MGNFKRNDRSNGRGNSGGFSGRDSAREMHKAVCSKCGKDCEVPFKPTGEKPVFCSDCFRSQRNDTPGRFSGNDSGRFNSGDKKMYKAVCDKCGKECEVPFKPTGDKPVYCNQCFGKGGKDKGSSQSGGQFEVINAKLDEILRALGSATPAKADKKKKAAKKAAAPKPKAEKISKPKDKKAVSPKKAKPKPAKKKK